MRNLDITTLRSFVAVAENGGVTRAAGFLNLTQSAVSMQLKRLEELLNVALFDRSGRTIALTAEGEQLLTFARRMVSINDEAVSRLMDTAFEGEVTLGVPHDIVYPAIPRVLKQFNAAYPRVQVSLVSSYTRRLLAEFRKGNCDVILTTEAGPQVGGEELARLPLCWIGAVGGVTWKQRPIKLAFGRHCLFRPQVVDALQAAGIDWDQVVESDNDRTIEATVSADLAVQANIEGTEPPHLERIDHGGALPDLPLQHINMYVAQGTGSEVIDSLTMFLRRAFDRNEIPQMRAV